MTDRTYFVKFLYDYYCQGYEEECEYALVVASSKEEAEAKIRARFYGAKDFVHLTIS